MCSRPQIKDGKTFACRSCDECIASRRAGWVARCMAETTQWKRAVCVSLTYDDNAPGGYDAARFFAYVDVRSFIQRITAALRRINKSLCVRFICAGEQGDRNGRCHWHLILWSDYDLRTLGDVTIRGNVITNPEDMMSKGKRKRRLHWSLWAVDGHPLGFVTFGAADQAGASYVVSYCLKDQFTAEKSKGTGREAKSENFATGLFRMSKRPAIGERWLSQKLSRLEAAQAVLPNTMLSIPGYSWEWYPTGTLREKLLVGLRAINEKRNEAGLGDAPQWPGLLASCKDNPKDMEILNGQIVEEEKAPEWACDTTKDLSAYRRRGWHYNVKRQRVPVCGSELPCDDCLGFLSRKVLASIGVERHDDPEGGPSYYWRLDNRWDHIHERREREAAGGLAPFCQGTRY